MEGFTALEGGLRAEKVDECVSGVIINKDKVILGCNM
jgi:hypothetical protein